MCIPNRASHNVQVILTFLINPNETKMSKLLEGLNSSQREAVTHKEGPLLIIAGPGSGKTRTIVRSIAYAIENLGVDPSKIAAFTFTNKAKDELKNRVSDFVEQNLVNDVWIRTFHSFCGYVWKNHPERPNIENERDFAAEELTRIYKERERTRYQIDDLQYRKFVDGEEILNTIKQWEERGISPAKISNQQCPQICVDVYKKYKQILENSSDIYTKIQLFTNALLRDVPEVRTKWQERFELIFVDEFQDTDHIQYEIIKALAGQHPNLRVVGDDDQGIYGWRGADIQNILNFENDYSTHNPIRLGQNYRSTQRIVEASRALAEFNPDRQDKELFTRNLEGEKVKHLHCENANIEANTIANFINRAIQEGQNPSHFAVLYRTKDQAHTFEKAFSNSKIRCYNLDKKENRLLKQPERTISLMTIHKSKGLEFPNVFVSGVCSGLLPHYKSKQEDWDEELRLLYVAMTRAKNWLCLSSYEEDAKFSRGRSPFLSYIPSSLLKTIETLDDIPIPPKPEEMERPVTKEPSNYEPLPEKLLGSGMTVIGVDPGNIGAYKTNVGWSVTQKVSDGYSVLDHDTEHPTGKKEDRLKQIEHTINCLVAEHLPDAIAVEKLEIATESSKANWFYYVAGCVAAIRTIADQHGIECRLYTPQQVKYAATGNKQANKEQVEQGVKKRSNLRKSIETDHEADAIAVSLCYLRSHLNSSRFEGNKRKQECYKAGCNYLNKGQYDVAAAKFQEAVNIDPIYTDAHYGLGRASLGQGDLEAAENAAKTALRLSENNHPDSRKLLDAIGRYRLGRNFMNNKQFDKAIVVFQESINLEPIFIDAHYELSRAYLGAGNLETAKDVIQKSLGLKDNYLPIQNLLDAITLYYIGLNFFSEQLYDKAIDKFKEAIDREQFFIEAHWRIGQSHFERGDLAAAERAANNILELYIDHQLALDLLDDIKQTYINRSQGYLRQDELIAAEESARAALRLAPNYQPAQELLDAIKQVCYNRGRDHLDNQRYDEAIVAFEEIVNKYPRFTAAYCGLGRVFLEQGNLIEAENAVKEALRLEDDNQIALQVLENIKRKHYERGMGSLGQDDLVSAEESANEILRIDSNYQLAQELLNAIQQEYYKQGGIYIETGKYSQAINSLLKASDIDPQDKEVWTNLGRAYYWIDDYVNAADCYQKATDIDPNDKIAYTNLGNAYYWMGKYEMAVGLFQKAINIDQNCKKACNYLARTRSKINKKTKQERAAPEGTALIFESEFQIKHNDRTVPENKKSRYSIYIDSFYTDKYTVTNAQYKKFLDANPQWSKNLISREYRDGNYLKRWYQNNYPSGEDYSPVIYVSWYAAMAYALWVGKRLPTEAEWEKAADFRSYQTYGFYSRSNYVLEWCLDEFHLDFYENSPRKNPIIGVDEVDKIISNFTNVKTSRVLRRGNWNGGEFIPSAERHSMSPISTSDSVHFRCVSSLND